MSRAARPAAAPDGSALDRAAPRNEVVLVGRVPATPEERELPSGDLLVTWRVVVARPPGRRPPEGVRATTVDTLDCVAWSASARRAASALLAGDVVEVSGALRRRFWRAGAGAASRCEVEASTVRRVSRRPPRTTERPAPASPPSRGTAQARSPGTASPSSPGTAPPPSPGTIVPPPPPPPSSD